MKPTLIILSLLLLCGTAFAEIDCDDWKNTGIPFWYGENAVARQSCREANALEDIATALKRIAEQK